MVHPKILGIITARGGSKGVPGKNIKLLGGKPLIVYTIEAAKKSGVFDRIILTTDDPKIAEVAKKYGCEVPFMRPAELAGDGVQHLPVLRHAVQWLKDNEGYSSEYIMTLQPTSPFRQPEHIQQAVDIILKTGADSVLGVSEIPGHFSPHKSMTLDDDAGKLVLFNGSPVKKRTMRRQDLPTCYFSNGTIYLYKTSNLFLSDDQAAFFGDDVRACVIDFQYSLDIDTPEDWELAEFLFAKMNRSKN